MVSNSKDHHPNKATPVTSTGVATHPTATIATRPLLTPLQLHEPVWEKRQISQWSIQEDSLMKLILFMISCCFHFGQYTLLNFLGRA